MAVKDVAIIGCGVSGLTSIKSCLDAGLNPVCFEQQTSFGGVWNYADEPRPNLGSVHKSTVTNTSKLMTAFSDFPAPKEFPNYLPQKLLQEYFEIYAKEFELMKYVEFNTEVIKLKRSADHRDTGKWIVSTRKVNENDAQITTKTFDAVMVCNGHYSEQVEPNIPGIEKFQGVKVHSGDYRTFQPFVGKRVVIVGCSHSAADIAVDLSHGDAEEVYISTRSGCYALTRLGSGGQPVDFALSRITSLIPMQIRAKLASALWNTKVNFKDFGLHPTGIIGITQYPIVNDELPHRILTGHIKVKGDIKEITEHSVILHGGETLENIDVLVLATGFKPTYPFAKDIIEVKDDFYISFYKHIFLPDDKWNTLAVIGAVGVSGPVPPVNEMQARVAAEVFAGRCSLPSNEYMKNEIANRERWWLKTGASAYNFMRVNYVPYMNELGDMIGVNPNLWSIFKEDPKLAYQCIFDTTIPSQYRLQGPNIWKGARQHIMTLREQYIYPLRTERCASLKPKGNYGVFVFIFVAMLAIVVVMFKT